MARTQIDLLKGSILKVMIAFAIPFLVSNILQQLYNTVDTIIVGYNLGDASLAAIGASGPLYNLLVGLALGIGSGMSIVLGRNYGAGDQERLKSSVAATLIIGTTKGQCLEHLVFRTESPCHCNTWNIASFGF